MMPGIDLRIRRFRSVHASIHTTAAISLLVLLVLGGCGTAAPLPTPTPEWSRLFPVPPEILPPEETLPSYCETTPDGSASGSSISISLKEVLSFEYRYVEIYIDSPGLSCVPDLLTASTSEPSHPLSLQFYDDGPHCYILEVYATPAGEYEPRYHYDTGAFYSLDGNSYQIWSSYDDQPEDQKWWIEEVETEMAFSAFADFSGALNDMSIVIEVASGETYELNSSWPLAKIPVDFGPMSYQVWVGNTDTGETMLSDTGTIDAEDWSLVQVLPDFATRSVSMEEVHCD